MFPPPNQYELDQLVPLPARGSDAPLTVDLGGRSSSYEIQAPRPRAMWLGIAGYLLAGVVIGVVLIVGLSITRASSLMGSGSAGSVSANGNAGAVTDETVHVQTTQLGASCRAVALPGSPVRVSVSIELDVDGKIKRMASTGGSETAQRCVEAHVATWTFVPQKVASRVVLPFEISASP
jgi:hypothetical protein